MSRPERPDAQRTPTAEEALWLGHFAPHVVPTEVTLDLLHAAGESALLTAITAEWVQVWIDGGYTITVDGRAALAAYRAAHPEVPV